MLLDTEIVIPSAGRPGKVRSFSVLPPEARAITRIAVPAQEMRRYRIYHEDNELLAVPESVKGIAATRQWLTERCRARFLMQISDDVTFFRRVEPRSVKLRAVAPTDLSEMLVAIHGYVVEYGHAGISFRGGNNHVDEEVKLAGARMCDVYIHDTHLLGALGIRWDRQPVMEDLDVTLQLLRRGYANPVLYEWCWNQNSSNLAGGCSTYRNAELQMEGALALEYHHPRYVSAREKKAKNWKGFGDSRWDVTVQWEKAFRERDLA